MASILLIATGSLCFSEINIVYTGSEYFFYSNTNGILAVAKRKYEEHGNITTDFVIDIRIDFVNNKCSFTSDDLYKYAKRFITKNESHGRERSCSFSLHNIPFTLEAEVVLKY